MIDGAAAGPTIRVVLVDDQALMRTAFRIIFDETDDLEVVGEAADGSGAVEASPPDPTRRGPDGHTDAGHRRHRGDPPIRSQAGGAAEPRVLILTTFDLDEYVYEALRAGASGFLLKDALAADLIAAVRTVAAGEAVTAPSITRRLIEHFVGGHRPSRSNADRLAALTEREREVLTPDHPRPIQRRDRPGVVPVRQHGQHPHRADPRQARPARPRPRRHPRVRVRPGPTRQALTWHARAGGEIPPTGVGRAAIPDSPRR